jgi:AraC family transcriptional regulator
VEKFEPTRHEDGRPMLLGGLRRHHKFQDAERSIAEQWRQFNSLGQIPGQLGSIAYGVICGHQPNGFEYMCGFEVDSFSGLPSDMGRIRTQEQHYAVFLHREHASQIRTTWERILKEWLPNSGYDSAHKPDFEVYDRQFNPNTGLGGIEIWISIVSANQANS